jgi:hypothetical protein
MFPFNDISVTEIEGLAYNLEQLDEASKFLDAFPKFRERGLCLAIHRISQTGLKLSSLKFLDCCSSKSQICILAACLGISTLIGFEFDYKNHVIGLNNIKMTQSLRRSGTDINIQISSFLDDFKPYFDVIFLDVTVVADLGYDEGMFLKQFFAVLRNSLPGTYVILISKLNHLCMLDFSADQLLTEIFSSRLCDKTSINLYLYQVILSRS